MISARDLIQALEQLQVGESTPIIAHASLSAFGYVEGGGLAVRDALLQVFHTMIMPSFTYKTMVVPEVGPANNGITYGGRDTNLMAEIYSADMPCDPTMGVVAESLRRHPLAQRSIHPILSFSGVNADTILESQNLEEPLAPVEKLLHTRGWVLLLGVGHSVNTSIHYAERIVDRKQFVRWALTNEGVVACPRFSGCSDGFDALSSSVEGFTRRVQVGDALIQAVPLEALTAVVIGKIALDPLALLCSSDVCERCAEVRRSVSE